MKRAKSPERMAEVPAMTKGSHPPRCRDNEGEMRRGVVVGQARMPVYIPDLQGPPHRIIRQSERKLSPWRLSN